MTTRRPVVALDLSTSTGWSFWKPGDDEKPAQYGRLPKVLVEDFNVNDHPEKRPAYPWNIYAAAQQVAQQVDDMIVELKVDPVDVVIENTVNGKNRNTQRLLEWLHFTVLARLGQRVRCSVYYRDVSDWRSATGTYLSKDEKRHNRHVSAGRARGRVSRKHVAIRRCKELFGITFKVKDNDVADAVMLGYAFVKEGTK